MNEFLWYIPNQVEPGHRGDDAGEGHNSLDRLTELARLVEDHGWGGALLGTGWGRPDTFTVGTALAARTTTFQPLVAIRPGYWRPANFASAASTLDELVGRPVAGQHRVRPGQPGGVRRQRGRPGAALRPDERSSCSSCAGCGRRRTSPSTASTSPSRTPRWRRGRSCAATGAPAPLLRWRIRGRRAGRGGRGRRAALLGRAARRRGRADRPPQGADRDPRPRARAARVRAADHHAGARHHRRGVGRRRGEGRQDGGRGRRAGLRAAPYGGRAATPARPRRAAATCSTTASTPRPGSTAEAAPAPPGWSARPRTWRRRCGSTRTSASPTSSCRHALPRRDRAGRRPAAAADPLISGVLPA